MGNDTKEATRMTFITWAMTGLVGSSSDFMIYGFQHQTPSNPLGWYTHRELGVHSEEHERGHHIVTRER